MDELEYYKLDLINIQKQIEEKSDILRDLLNEKIIIKEKILQLILNNKDYEGRD